MQHNLFNEDSMRPTGQVITMKSIYLSYIWPLMITIFLVSCNAIMCNLFNLLLLIYLDAKQKWRVYLRKYENKVMYAQI